GLSFITSRFPFRLDRFGHRHQRRQQPHHNLPPNFSQVTSMGKRKKSSRKPTGPKKNEPLATTFSCLFCNHEKSVTCVLDKKAGVGSLSCKVCGQRFQANINYLSAAIDVYSEWVDACDEIANPKEKAPGRVSGSGGAAGRGGGGGGDGGAGSKTQHNRDKFDELDDDDDDDIGGGYGGRAQVILDDDEEDF
ncbi:hypothetical protein HOY80DRAFT_882714, partial [Tuber brumale]